jgi:hypothetical protein
MVAQEHAGSTIVHCRENLEIFKMNVNVWDLVRWTMFRLVLRFPSTECAQ